MKISVHTIVIGLFRGVVRGQFWGVRMRLTTIAWGRTGDDDANVNITPYYNIIYINCQYFSNTTTIGFELYINSEYYFLNLSNIRGYTG